MGGLTFTNQLVQSILKTLDLLEKPRYIKSLLMYSCSCLHPNAIEYKFEYFKNKYIQIFVVKKSLKRDP